MLRAIVAQALYRGSRSHRLPVVQIRDFATKREATGKKETKEKQEKKETKQKKAKQAPTAAKRPLSAFMLFSMKERPILKQEKPELTFVETGKELGARWKNLPDGKKKEFEVAAQYDMERYKKEMEMLNSPN